MGDIPVLCYKIVLTTNCKLLILLIPAHLFFSLYFLVCFSTWLSNQLAPKSMQQNLKTTQLKQFSSFSNEEKPLCFDETCSVSFQFNQLLEIIFCFVAEIMLSALLCHILCQIRRRPTVKMVFHSFLKRILYQLNMLNVAVRFALKYL